MDQRLGQKKKKKLLLWKGRRYGEISAGILEFQPRTWRAMAFSFLDVRPSHFQPLFLNLPWTSSWPVRLRISLIVWNFLEPPNSKYSWQVAYVRGVVLGGGRRRWNEKKKREAPLPFFFPFSHLCPPPFSAPSTRAGRWSCFVSAVSLSRFYGANKSPVIVLFDQRLPFGINGRDMALWN